ncbi:MAG TPA: LCP family protein [Segeticoccus sp.]|uniref:LCP family protein n=1 Tax=Segeticoccus sp. TaxID=2706531 RepID=UPI002D808C91|nr:LCP family protein [Segeticoccus sp.]HET8601500.1 LCP family protein [Segeticoccus sp.]
MSYLPRDDAGAHASGRRVESRQHRRHGVGRAIGLTALGTVVPGAGLSFTRGRVLGLALVGLFVAGLVAIAAWVWHQGALRAVLSVAVRPNVLVALTVAVVIVALVWVAQIVWTAHLADPGTLTMPQTRVLRLSTLILCLVVIAPTIQAVRYLGIQRDVVHSVFQGKAADGGGGNTAYAKPDTSKSDPWADTTRVNVLLLGSDAGKDRTGVRTDSMIVASVDTHTGDAVLFSVPRNLENVPFPKDNPLHKLYPQGYNCGDQCLMNAVWTLADQHKDLFPASVKNPGLLTTQQVLEKVLGLRIDYTTIIDLHGFTELVDAMGGVTIDVKERLPIGGVAKNGYIVPGSIKGWINPGVQHLTGYQALWYARSRATTDDFSRMRRQRCMVGALLDQVNPVSMLQKYPQLAQVAKDNIQTDIPTNELPAWVTLVQRIQKGEIRSLAFTPDNTNVVHPDFAKMRQLVKRALQPPKPAPSKSHGTPKPSHSPSPSGTTPSPGPSQDAGSAVNVKQAC